MDIYSLKPYQLQVAKAVLRSIEDGKGLSFSVMIARQGGKNELSAWLEAVLLGAAVHDGGSAIKASLTFHPQARISISRLQETLRRSRIYFEFQHGNLLAVGRARQLFLSAHPTSNVIGNTASLLLEIDESQDISPDKFNRDFMPMGATSNATTVHYGTAWDDHSLLEQVKQSNIELQRTDGIRRHFEFDWKTVARHNPHYKRYVEAERLRLGSDHPLFRSQYCLVPVTGKGRFIDHNRQALLRGSHHRISAPVAGRTYVAGVDLAGESEQSDERRLKTNTPFRDSTVVTIGELRSTNVGLGSEQSDERRLKTNAPFRDSTAVTTGELPTMNAGHGSTLPSLRVVEHFWWTGLPHSESFSRLVHILSEVWGCRRVVVDATGIGAGVAGFLHKSIGPSIVKPFTFTARSKSDLGFDLLAAINSGRLRMYKPDGSPESTEFWSQISKARRTVRPNQTINFFVDPSEGHYDFLSSLALLVKASEYTPRRASGRLREGYE